MKLEFSRQIFEKYLNIKCHENPSSGNRVVPRGRTDMTKLTVAFRNFVNAVLCYVKFSSKQFNYIVMDFMNNSGAPYCETQVFHKGL
jgi:hypothetical protein